jgi:hypothetical protein
MYVTRAQVYQICLEKETRLRSQPPLREMSGRHAVPTGKMDFDGRLGAVMEGFEGLGTS